MGSLLYLALLLQGLLHAAKLARLEADCEALLDAAAAARRHAGPQQQSPTAAAAADADVTVHLKEARSALSFGVPTPALDAEEAELAATSFGDAAPNSTAADLGNLDPPDAAATTANTGGTKPWHLLAADVAAALRELLPGADGPFVNVRFLSFPSCILLQCCCFLSFNTFVLRHYVFQSAATCCVSP